LELYRLKQEQKHIRKTLKGKDDPTKEFKFWNTQPVPKFTDHFNEHGPLDVPKTVADVRPEPYSMPEGFEWCSLDISSSEHLKEMYVLLYENYVEDDESTFR
jgi:glycylpeptide N-tetradecanoyltransferase